MNEHLAAQVAEYIQTTDAVIHDQNTLIAALRSQQKVASQAPAVTPDPVKVGAMMDRIVEAGFITPNQKEASFRSVMQNPAVLIDFVEKLAARSIQDTVPEVGAPVDPNSGLKPAATRKSDDFFEQTFQ